MYAHIYIQDLKACRNMHINLYRFMHIHTYRPGRLAAICTSSYPWRKRASRYVFVSMFMYVHSILSVISIHIYIYIYIYAD